MNKLLDSELDSWCDAPLAEILAAALQFTKEFMMLSIFAGELAYEAPDRETYADQI